MTSSVRPNNAVAKKKITRLARAKNSNSVMSIVRTAAMAADFAL